MPKPPLLPTSLPGCDLMPYVSAKRRNQIVDTLFEMLGGVERMQAWAENNYGDFMAIWAKGLPRNAATEHSLNTDSIENLLAKLDKAENAQLIDGECTVVNPEDDHAT